MSYVVNWRGSDGQAGWHPVGDLQEAAAHVEHLRNSEGVSETKIFKLDEVQFEFRQYFRVELAPAADEPAAAPAPTFAVSTEPEPEAVPAPVAVEVPAAIEVPAWTPEAAEMPAEPVFDAPAPEPVLAEVGGDDASANGQRRGLFGR